MEHDQGIRVSHKRGKYSLLLNKFASIRKLQHRKYIIISVGLYSIFASRQLFLPLNIDLCGVHLLKMMSNKYI